MKNLISLFLACLLVTFTTSFASEEVNTSELENPSKSQICSSNECYTIIKKLGEGAFGEVFEVENSEGEHFAIKSYKYSSDSFMADSFYTDAERELLRGQTLNHPNIIKAYDLFESENNERGLTQNLVLQLVNGNTLYNTGRGSLSNETAIINALQLCDALNYALSLGLMHLDLHGNNVMINDNSEMMVIDLASFFEMDEIISGYSSYEYETESQFTETKEGKSHLTAKTSSNTKNAIPKNDRITKLHQIFKENPKLVKQLKIAKAAVEKKKAQLKVKDDGASLNSSKSYSDIETEYYRNYYSHYYLSTITEICGKLISKSSMDKNSKLDLRADIKKISWGYEEDIEDQCSMPVEHYFTALIETLQSKLALTEN